MPPKKKKSSKKSGKKGKKSGKTIKVEDIQIDEPELNKEFFIFHIKDLERKLRLYKEKAEKLESENKEYLDKQNKLNTIKNEKISLYKTNLLQRGDELSDLKDRYQGLDQAKETEKSRYEAKLQDIQSRMQETKDALTADNNLLSAKLSALDEFKVQKEKYQEEYANLVQEYEQKKLEHEEVLQKINDKQVQDRDRLKKEIVSKINTVAADFRRISQKQISETTKRTIRENVSIRSQLTKMDDRNLELLQENMEMKKTVRQNKTKLKELERGHNDLASKNNSHTKLLHMLMLKYQEYKELCDEYSEEDKILEKFRDDCRDIEKELETIKSEILDQRIDNDLIQDNHLKSERTLDEINNERNEAKLALIGAIKELRSLLSVQKQQDRATSKLKSASSNSAKGKATLSEVEREWGTILERSEAEEKLKGILDYLDYQDDDEDDERETAESRPSSANKAKLPLSSQSNTRQKLNTAGSSITLDSQKIRRNKTPLAPINSSQNKNTKPKILSEYEIRREAQTILRQQRKGYCVPGLLQIVPHMTRHIPTSLEKSEKLNKRLIGEQVILSENDLDKPILRSNINQSVSDDAKIRYLGTTTNVH